MEKLKDLLKLILMTIAQSTPVAKIEWDEEESQFVIQVAGIDQGRLVGKNGATISAINIMFWYAGLKRIQKTVGIRLLEPVTGHKGTAIPYMPKSKFDRERFGWCMDSIIEALVGDPNEWSMTGEDGMKHKVLIELAPETKDLTQDPDLTTALEVLTKTIGRSCGGSMDVTVTHE